MSSHQLESTNQVKLDDVIQALRHWRANKSSYDGIGIPNTIWSMIFRLEEQGYIDSELRGLFGLNSSQYKRKREEFITKPSEKSDKDMTSQVDIDADLFVEAKIATTESKTKSNDVPALTRTSEKAKQTITRLKTADEKPDAYLDTTTVIVECIRPDGFRLKIHTASHGIDKVMQSFFSMEGTALC